ncbi:sel1 repeat family protein [Tardiphaga alba]|uniref:Sel1 repeat family protein n=1 Tax=Tardiphaga alba TaxID=340268 RepID=A0ABX8A3M1_9BRAD|nr:tetratricopeptide repeat protein [Tardiphaga alba]QUS38173.1 sel1 repeat family protein [Tardiphaga alba]
MKLFALLFSCLLLVAPPANASDRDTFDAMAVMAGKGDAEAQYHIGMMYNNGIGTAQDRKQALDWFEKSAAANHPLGAYKLGCYYDGQGEGIITSDADQALKYKLVAAEAGYALAQQDVANLYDRRGNSEQALRWWKMAGAQGYPPALFSLFRAYSEGKGAPQDLSLSYAYFKLSEMAPRKKVGELATFLSPAELKAAEKMVAEWKPQVTALTLKARKGISAAEDHVKTARN